MDTRETYFPLLGLYVSVCATHGVSGVCRQDQNDPKNSEMRQLLTGAFKSCRGGLLWRRRWTKSVAFCGQQGAPCHANQV